jgi:3-hydroxyisobutyrate dehydrogenase-like beta-hydroxyacid dehydrogenase
MTASGVRVGFIGLGSQGAPMATRIIEAGYPTTLWARRDASLDPFRSTAAGLARSPAALGEASDVVCLCVFGDDDVREVVGALLGGMARGSTLVVHSTVHPRTIAEVAGLAEAAGIEVVDAPVSGGGDAALAGRLCVMVGGTEASFERVRPVLETFGDPVRRVGPPGAGALTKLINNLLFMANIAVADEALRVAVALGADRAGVAEILASGSGNSYALGVVSRMPRGHLDLIDVAGPVLGKDLAIIEELLKAGSVPAATIGAAAAAALKP